MNHRSAAVELLEHHVSIDIAESPVAEGSRQGADDPEPVALPGPQHYAIVNACSVCTEHP
jgi:hypothetical protein